MLFRGTEESETRTLTIVGAVVLVSIAIAATAIWLNPFKQARTGVVSIVVESPFVGQGVATGTAIMLRGMPVGEVTSVSSLPRGGVRLGIDVEQRPTAGLTDTFDIDFRPANYFGVTGINLLPGPGGQPLHTGAHLNIVPKGNYTLQALLSRLGDVSNGVISPRLIDVIERATGYLDALNPLIETMLITADTVARVQNVSTERLLINATGISVAFPSVLDGALSTLAMVYKVFMSFEDDRFWYDVVDPSLVQIGTKFFGQIGELEYSHQYDLTPWTEIIKSFADVVPGIVPPTEIAGTARELRTRLERMYAGSPEQRALQVQIVLDSLPGVAAPAAQLGAGQ